MILTLKSYTHTWWMVLEKWCHSCIQQGTESSFTLKKRNQKLLMKWSPPEHHTVWKTRNQSTQYGIIRSGPGLATMLSRKWIAWPLWYSLPVSHSFPYPSQEPEFCFSRAETWTIELSLSLFLSHQVRYPREITLFSWRLFFQRALLHTQKEGML